MGDDVLLIFDIPSSQPVPTLQSIEKFFSEEHGFKVSATKNYISTRLLSENTICNIDFLAKMFVPLGIKRNLSTFASLYYSKPWNE